MIQQSDRAIRSICIVGAGITGLSAAIAFARSLPSVPIILVATPPDPENLTDRLPGSLPSTRGFHALIGISETELVQQRVATHRLGTRYDGWSADGVSWTRASGEYGLPADGIAFHLLWVIAKRAGDMTRFHDYSMAAVLANEGKFVHPTTQQGSPLSTFDYALRLDPTLYQERLAAQCAGLNIVRADGGLADVERRSDGGIASLLLLDGQTIAADLFIDCAGPAAPLIAAVSDTFEDWGAWLPCDRLVFDEERAGEPNSCDHVSATADGWRVSVPMADRTLLVAAHASAFEIQPPHRDAVKLRSGVRAEPWVHNVLALGDAALAIDPLLPIHLSLVHNAIARALSLLPGRDCHPVELREYNRRSAQEARRVRDFAALHYVRSGRNTGAVWRAMALAPLPDSLAHTLDQFEARGRLPFYEEEIFDRHGWLAVLLGMGITPHTADPASTAIDGKIGQDGMARLAATLRDIAQRAPTYAA